MFWGEIHFQFKVLLYRYKKYHRVKKTPVTGLTELQATIKSNIGLIIFFIRVIVKAIVSDLYASEMCE